MRHETSKCTRLVGRQEWRVKKLVVQEKSTKPAEKHEFQHVKNPARRCLNSLGEATRQSNFEALEVEEAEDDNRVVKDNSSEGAVMVGIWFQQSKHDYSMFTRTDDGHCTVVVAYVDDLLITDSSLPLISTFNVALQITFTIKDLGELTYFLGIEVLRNPSGILLNQRKYILDMLTARNMLEYKTEAFPFSKAMDLSSDEGDPIHDPELYMRLIGKLLYLNMTRPDISYMVQQLSQFLSDQRVLHLTVDLHVLRYLKGNIHYGLICSSQNDLSLSQLIVMQIGLLVLSLLSLILVIVFFLVLLLFLRRQRKQKVVSKSSTEAEYRIMSYTTSEVV
ncbi:uncharacterized mitochondrial protein AtMg00810-like [Beta vulgaris subsp. vulgaris]|uniref:uncharacterized mitochondrial protein AtMg00810-like n=1 Tax=Beta vulgaris subsp. vulgaris TaxID=3555 RepID=UPI00254720D2|nr:uncharacterized mitochondrial protein AtMg00810-like [Beta vulgaris subsp. vulgaris]